MVRAATPTRLRMSFEEYEAWTDEDTHSEWVDGEVTVFMPSTPRHQAIKNFLSVLLTLFVDLRGLGRIYDAPLEMKLRAGRSYREPDILFVASAHLDRITAKRLDGAADLVIEILSKDDPARDRVEKFAEYEAAGIPEYWIVEGRDGRSGVWLHGLGQDRRYAPIPVDEAGRLRSWVLPGFWLDPAWLAADPPPSVLACFRAMAPDAFGNA